MRRYRLAQSRSTSALFDTLVSGLSSSAFKCHRRVALSSNLRFRMITGVSRRRRFPTASPKVHETMREEGLVK